MLLDAASVRERARRLREVSALTRRTLDDAIALRHLAGRVTWLGPAAERFDDRIGAQLRELECLVDRLHHDARRLDALADALAVG
jgi:hypothetical protein